MKIINITERVAIKFLLNKPLTDYIEAYLLANEYTYDVDKHGWITVYGVLPQSIDFIVSFINRLS